MRKFNIIAILVILDITLYFYLDNLLSKRIPFELKIIEDSILYQTNDININDINEFEFNKYFRIIGSDNYNYRFDDNYIYITFNGIEYSFEYKLIEPEVIEKVVYKEIETHVDNEEKYNYTNDEYFYVISNYLYFNLNEDLNNIREVLIDNLCTSVQASVDYSQLNVSQIGQYSVFYISNNEKIEIIVEIG